MWNKFKKKKQQLGDMGLEYLMSKAKSITENLKKSKKAKMSV